MKDSDCTLQKAKQLKYDILFGKWSDCKHCAVASCGIAGNHYLCDNEKSGQYGILMPICSEECSGFEK